MRITMLVIALTLGAAAPTLAGPRILLVQEPGPVTAPPAAAPAQESAPAEAPPAPPPPAQVQQPAPAQTPPVPPSRFTFERSHDGFVRFDNQSGQIAACAPRSAGWACEVVPDGRTALEKEIGRLQDEITRMRDEMADLKRELAALREPPPPRPPAELAPRPPSPKDGGAIIKLPSQEDIDRATAAMQHAWERLVDMIGNLKKDLSRKSQPDRTVL